MSKSKPEVNHLKDVHEDGNTVGGGAIAGCGVGPDGEPGVKRGNKTAVVLADVMRRNFGKSIK